MSAVLYALLILGLVLLDQLTKFLVRAHIPLGETIPFLPGVLGLSYARNTGAAFSLFREHTWLLTLISAVVSLLLLAALIRKVLPHPAGRIILSVILAGAVGNLIDRFFLGYVTDMFRTLFMDFPVFNVADICLTLGCIAFAVYILFFYDRPEEGGEGHGQADADG